MQNRRGYVYPRIKEEVVDTAELRKVWQCGYGVVNRIVYGRQLPNHRQKEQLSEYLGIPVAELFVRVDDISTPTVNSEIISESDNGV